MQNPPVFPIIIGVTGHRDIAPEASAAVLKSVQDLLEDWKSRFGAALHVMTALAEGADQLVADAARMLEIPIIAVLPMPEARYRKTFRGEESWNHLERLRENAALQLELPEIGDPGDTGYRDGQFEQLGVLLIRRSHLLLALWDGMRDTTNRGGAAAVVRMRLEGDHGAETFKSSEMFLEVRSYLDVTNRGPLLHVVTPSDQTTKDPAGTCLLLGVPEAASKRHGNGGSAADAIWTGTALDPKDLIRAITLRGFEYFDRIDELNLRMVDFGRSDTRIFELQIGYLDVEGIPVQTRHPTEVLIRQQAGADTAAQAHQARLLGHFVPARSIRHMLANGIKAWRRTGTRPNVGAAFIFAVMVPLAVFFYETHVVYHKKIGGFVALLLYVICLGSTFYYYWFHVRRQNWQGYFQDYRALAEGMRVQLYWALAAVPAAVSDHYLRKQSDELGWIQFALRGPALWAAALADLQKVPNREVVRRGWIENQAHYFGDKAKLHDGAYKRGNRCTKVLVWCGFGVTVALLLFEFYNRLASSYGGDAGGWLGLMENSEECIIIVAATLPALAALFSVSGELRAYEPSAHSYTLMNRMFGDAAEEARKPDQSNDDFKELVRELGREALAENAEWLTEHLTGKLNITSDRRSWNAPDLDKVCPRSAGRRQPMSDIDLIAAAIHETWRALSREEGRSMQPHLDRPYADLAGTDKDDNRAAARRMGDVLAVAGLGLSNDPARPEASLPHDLEPMAEAEHNGWMSQRAQSGWSWAATRDDNAKRHPSMLPYKQLPESEKEKDRNNVRHYPEFAARAAMRIVSTG